MEFQLTENLNKSKEKLYLIYTSPTLSYILFKIQVVQQITTHQFITFL